MKQSMEQKMTQKLSTELSYKVMQIGEAVLQIEEEYIDVIPNEDLKNKIHLASKLLKEIADQMVDIHAERMLNWKKYVRQMTSRGFL